MTFRGFLIELNIYSVGVAGFEPTTSCSQSRRDTGLRYTPNWYLILLVIIKLPFQAICVALPVQFSNFFVEDLKRLESIILFDVTNI